MPPIESGVVTLARRDRDPEPRGDGERLLRDRRRVRVAEAVGLEDVLRARRRQRRRRDAAAAWFSGSA